MLILWCAGLLSPAVVNAGGKEDAAALGALLIDVRRVLPAGWEADITPADFGKEDFSRDDLPALIVRSKKKLEVEVITVSAPPLQPGETPETQLQQVTLRFECRPYISRRKYAEQKDANKHKQQQRLKFQRTRLADIPWASKASPFPPRAFQPRNQAEAALVREYQFLWMRTSPVELPTHFHGGLAFQLQRSWYIHIVKPAESDTFQQVLADVQKIIARYHPES